MIEVKQELFENLDTIEGLRQALKQAVRLEHATIPTYLYTWFSLDPAKNSDVRRLILGVAKEEMGHFALACNVLTAIGGLPEIDHPDFVPSFPGPLPGSIDDGFQISLAPYGTDHVKNVFMEIEHPDTPLEFRALMVGGAQEFRSIGDFYRAIQDSIKQQGGGIFVQNSFQVTGAQAGLPGVMPVTDVQSAVVAIDLIIEQGEGTSSSPSDDGNDNDLAHYYRFAELFHGHKLIRVKPATASIEEQFSYTGAAITADTSGVHAFPTNPKSKDYPPDARAKCDEFNRAYTQMLQQLQQGFTGHQELIATSATDSMDNLVDIVAELVKLRLTDGSVAAPTFEYLPPVAPEATSHV